MSDYTKDKEIIEAATPGPWEVRKWDGDEWPEKRLSLSDGEIALAINPRYTSLGAARKDFEYIAHFNPSYVSELVQKAQRCHELEKVLIELVMLKIHKDEAGKTDFYLQQQPMAWKRAKELLK